MRSAPEATATSSASVAWYLRCTMLGDDSSGQLVQRVRNERGDQHRAAREAETELCRRFAPRVRLYGLRHLRDEDRARDLVQAVLEVLIEAARAGRIENVELVERFVLGTCRNVALRVRALESRAVPTDPSELDIESVMPEMDRIETGALIGCIALLEERARAVIHLSFNEEKSADEIGAALGTTAGNVRVLRHRAVAQLRSCLDSHGAHP